MQKVRKHLNFEAENDWITSKNIVICSTYIIKHNFAITYQWAGIIILLLHLPWFTWAIPAPISPLPMTVTFFMALWLEEELNNAETTAKFFPNDEFLRNWADGTFEAVQRKREAIFEKRCQKSRKVPVWPGNEQPGLGTKRSTSIGVIGVRYREVPPGEMQCLYGVRMGGGALTNADISDLDSTRYSAKPGFMHLSMSSPKGEGGVGHRVGILTFSKKNCQNPHPRAKNKMVYFSSTL